MDESHPRLAAGGRARIGVFLPTRLAVLTGSDDPAPILELARICEAAGLDSVWVGDSLLARPRLEPLTLLAALAATTRRLTLGTAVLLPALRHPLVLAHAVATVDQLAQGRLVLGVGSGFAYPETERELAAVGVPFAERTRRVEATVALCRRLWAGETVASPPGAPWTFADVTLAPRPARAGGPPIWMGGNAPPALRRAGRLGDGWLPTSATADAFATGWAGVRGAAATAGRDPHALASAVVLTVSVDPDPGSAERTLRAFMESYYGAPYELLAHFIGCHAGDSASTAAWLAGYVAAGARHLVLRFAAPDQAAQLEHLTRAVLPRLEAAAA